ncbi:MAG: DUF5667 domain-containing protein [Actinomycetota bacterium]
MKDYEDHEDYKDVIDVLEKAAEAGPDAGFMAEARERLLDAVAKEPESARVIRFRPRRLVIRTLAAVVALLLLMTGVGFASTDSLPGDALYPIKRGIEEARLRVTRNDEAKANLYLEIAGRRLNESEALKRLNRRDRIEATLKLMSGNFGQAQALLNKVPAVRREVILKRLEDLEEKEKRAQAETRKQRILEKQQEKPLEQENRKNPKPEKQLQHFKNNSNSEGDSKKNNSRP